MVSDDARSSAEAPELIALTAQIVASHVGNNAVAPADVGELIRNVHETLSEVSNGAAEKESPKPEPAVNPKRSVRPEHIICLECGAKYSSMKRHLKTAHELEPEEYRQKWGLPQDYPMVSPNYARQRSDLAREIGLGRNNRKTPARKTRRKS